MPNVGQGSQATDSLFDFLYVDSVRAASWLAQLSDEGVLTGLRNSTTITEGKVSGLSGGIPSVAKADASIRDDIAEKHEQTYSTEWSLPLLLLDSLDEQKFIHRNVSTAAVGSIVLISGEMQITDVGMLQKIWDPTIKIMLRDQKTTHQNKAALTALKDQLGGFGDAIRAMPAEPQAHFRDHSGNTYWASIRPEHMTVNASTLALAHGSFVDGTWHVLAVLDAQPSMHDANGRDRISTGDMSETMMQVLQLVRTLVGRDESAYAITPIMIFRKTTSTT